MTYDAKKVDEYVADACRTSSQQMHHLLWLLTDAGNLDPLQCQAVKRLSLAFDGLSSHEKANVLDRLADFGGAHITKRAWQLHEKAKHGE